MENNETKTSVLKVTKVIAIIIVVALLGYVACVCCAKGKFGKKLQNATWNLIRNKK